MNPNIDPASLVGKIVRDITVTDAPVRYLVGKGGFMTLGTGDFTPYDSAFPGPVFFAAEAFEVEKPPNMSDDAAEALDALHYTYTQFAEAKTPIDQASALVSLHDAMHSMATWHPAYQYEYEHSQMPWQRNIED